MLAWKVSRPGTRSEFGASLFYHNAIFFPLVVLSGLYGPGSQQLTDLFVFAVFFPAFFFGTAPLFFGNRTGRTRLTKIVSPTAVATALALVLRLAGLQAAVPQFVMSITGLLGHMATPAIMLVLGGSIYIDWKEGSRIQAGEVAKFVALKNVVFPLLTIGVLWGLRPTPEVALLVVLQGAAPPITAIPLVAQREHGNKAIAGQFVVASFAASIVTVPFAVWLLNVVAR
jgi:predicted permease